MGYGFFCASSFTKRISRIHSLRGRERGRKTDKDETVRLIALSAQLAGARRGPGSPDQAAQLRYIKFLFAALGSIKIQIRKKQKKQFFIS